jgi:hypothetical protein
MDGLLCVIIVSLGVTEIAEDAIAQVLRHDTTNPRDLAGTASVIVANYFLEILGV